MQGFIAISTILLVILSPVSGIFFKYLGLHSQLQITPITPRQSPTHPSYDFIIVGAGSAGSVLANRLSEWPGWRVLLLEVGHHPNIVNEVPFLAPALQFTDYSWSYKMEKTPGVCLGMVDQRCPWPRGRGLGGTTLINYMIYTRGHRADYERWKAAGNPGWGYSDVLPYFLKSEHATLQNSDAGYHRQGGLLNVEDARWRSRVVDAFLEAGRDLGYPIVDYNGQSQEGFSYVQVNTKAGVRASGYRSFIAPAEDRPNLHILTEARATRLLIDPNTRQVYGVEYVHGRKYHYVNVTKEVILSAGAFNSPQLLMLSGIGPSNHLNTLGVPVLKNLPVGRNLHDHITFVGLFYIHESNDTGLANIEQLILPSTWIQWFKQGRGPLTSIGGVEALAYLNTNTSKNVIDIPDMELIMMNGIFDINLADILRRSLSITKEVFNRVFVPLINKPITVILPMHLKPKSIGWLELKSRNPYHWPKLFGNHLSDPENLDVKAFIAAIRFTQKLMRTKPFRKYNTRPIKVYIPGCESFKYDSDEYWECAIRHVSTTLHHQVGTCKMGPKNDPTAVVDNELRVHGIKGLRVADTSIIPFALNAHTNAPAYMIGEKTADYIKNEWK